MKGYLKMCDHWNSLNFQGHFPWTPLVCVCVCVCVWGWGWGQGGTYRAPYEPPVVMTIQLLNPSWKADVSKNCLDKALIRWNPVPCYCAQGFPNSIRRMGGGKFSGRNSKFYRGYFFTRWKEPEEDWFWSFELFQS